MIPEEDAPDDLIQDLESLPTLDDESLSPLELELNPQAWATQSPEIAAQVKADGPESLGMLARRRLATVGNKEIAIRNAGTRSLSMDRVQELLADDLWSLPVRPGTPELTPEEEEEAQTADAQRAAREWRAREARETNGTVPAPR